MSDARKKEIVIGVEAGDILARLERDRDVFDAVSAPALVHWDMWEGNIFVKDGQYQWTKPLFEDSWKEL